MGLAVKKMERDGYKMTEVGLVPEDWEVVELAQLAKIKRGASPRPIDSPIWFDENSEVGWVRISDVTKSSKYLLSTTQKLSMLGIKASRPVPKDSLIMSICATVGRPIITSIDTCIHDGFVVFNELQVEKDFAYHILTFIESDWSKNGQVGSQMNLNTNLINTKVIPLPPTKAEQTTIANALSDADALINSLEKLIEKKRAIKQGAMQELLTGRKRLAGFEGEWTRVNWGDVIESCSSGATPYRGKPQYYTGGVKWISSGELNYCIIEDSIEHISKEAVEKTNLKVHPVGTFLMAITGLEAEGTRGACAIVGSPATTNQSCMAIYTSKSLETQYLYHYYRYRGKFLAMEFCQGTKQQSYTAKLVKLLPIDLPPTIEEQNAIAEILSNMDSDIEALETKLSKQKLLKQAMMQELLTGKTRLI